MNIPKGTRYFNEKEILKREFLIKIIKNNFKLFGFSQIETPSFEIKSLLKKQYGEENEKLIFNILKTGFSFKENFKKLINKNDKEFLNYLSNKYLRYDLTIPFLKYIYFNKDKIIFPFKRYQIQMVWRADRPQKGRYQEFYQCDADIAGKKSLWQEIDLIQLYYKIFLELNIPTIIKINNRKILFGLIEIFNIKKHYEFIKILDKWDKIGKEKVKIKLLDKGLSIKNWKKLNYLYNNNTLLEEKIKIINFFLKKSEIGKKGINSIKFIFNKIKKLNIKNINLEFNILLSRGVNYYTGTIFEIFYEKNKKLAIGGGGRYDNIDNNILKLKNLSCVGISIGLDRVILIMEKLKLFPSIYTNKIKILFLNFGIEESLKCYKIINLLRNKEISSDLYPKNEHINKQIKYAKKKKITFIVMLGKKEIEKNIIKIKKIKNKKELTFFSIEDLINYFLNYYNK